MVTMQGSRVGMVKVIPVPHLVVPWFRVMRAERRARGWSQTKLAEEATAKATDPRLRFTKDMINSRERGMGKNPQPAEFEALERALDKPVGTFSRIHEAFPYVPHNEESPLYALWDIGTSGPAVIIDELTPAVRTLLSTLEELDQAEIQQLVQTAHGMPKKARPVSERTPKTA